MLKAHTAPPIVSYDEFKKATEAELGPMRVHEGTLGEFGASFILVWNLRANRTFSAFMFESSMQVTITDYAMKRSGKLHGKYILSSIEIIHPEHCMPL